MQDGNNNPVYKKNKKGRTVKERTHLKAKPKEVSHGTSTNYKDKLGSKRPTTVKVKRKKILTDGGFMYV